MKEEEKKKSLQSQVHKGIFSNDKIPHNLTQKILLRFPSKTLIKFQSVSKLWSSIITHPNFINSFMTQSSTHHSFLLINFQETNHQTFFYFTQHNKNLKKIKSLSIKLPKQDQLTSYTQFQSVHGLILLNDSHHITLWNPTLRQHITLHNSRFSTTYLGYDPIENRYKLLTIPFINTKECQILTLQDQETWRKIKNIPKRNFLGKGICINGVLYYTVSKGNSPHEIISFDVRFEKFRSIKVDKAMMNDEMSYEICLLSYKGRLGWVCLDSSLKMNLWVLEDDEKEEWICKEIRFMRLCNDMIMEANCSLIGVNDDDEVVYGSICWIKYESGEDDEIWRRDRGFLNWKFVGISMDQVENLMNLKNIVIC